MTPRNTNEGIREVRHKMKNPHTQGSNEVIVVSSWCSIQQGDCGEYLSEVSYSKGEEGYFSTNSCFTGGTAPWALNHWADRTCSRGKAPWSQLQGLRSQQPIWEWWVVGDLDVSLLATAVLSKPKSQMADAITILGKQVWRGAWFTSNFPFCLLTAPPQNPNK